MRLRLPRIPRRPGPLLLSGVLLGVAFPPFHLVIPSFLALVPFAVWVAGLPESDEQGRREALRGGFFLGLIYYTLVFYWLLTSLIYYTPLAILAFVLPVLILSTFLAAGSEAMRLVRGRLGWPVWLLLPVFWTALEWLRGHLGPVSFPWMQLGDSLATTPRLVGSADLVGSLGVSFWLALVGGLGAEVWLAWRSPVAGPGGRASATAGRRAGSEAEGALTGPRRRLRGPLLGLVMAVSLPIGYSLVRWSTLDLRPAARVGIIQPDVPEDVKMKSDAATDSGMTAFYRLSADSLLPHADSVQLVVLPEGVFPVRIERIPSVGWPGRTDIARAVQRVARGLDARILYGAFGTKDLKHARYALYNSAFLTDTAGRLIGRYDKHYLVPVVERVPFIPPAWLDRLQYFGWFSRGENAPVFRSDGGRFGVLICYEDVFAQRARLYRNEGADFLVNITNDAWFGRAKPWWSRTSALWQHPAHLVMRSIESRMGAVRSANTGISEIVDPLGRVSHPTALFTRAAFRGTVLTTDGRTLYDRWGDVVGWAAALAALAAVLAALWRGRRSGGALSAERPRPGAPDRPDAPPRTDTDG
ncbi:MAG: apolipoprotein N-acyltransferase [Candidatus Palauibacterales bacterium]|nr:apolipoprotein N-acyltransferase [Candidatus Palauibacterales bacterium]MDP2583064.1 apolipoprotein N-acyltransferase [Candidatus Palauibacterales bacterium]